MGSRRLAFALVVCGALVWVYGLTALCAYFFKPLFPKKGGAVVLIFLSAFMGSLYLLLLSFVSPLLVMETSFLILLTPLCCIGSGIGSRPVSPDPGDALFRVLQDALALGGVILALALIREPIGFASLSLPGGSRGVIEVFSAEGGDFFPVRIVSLSAGAFFLLGYGVALFHRFRDRDTRSGGDA
jgi:Na+-transporting NADH:ubiquinone oxidoreductase subunit NqrD